MSFGSWVWSWVKRVRGVSNYIVGSCESVAMHMGRLWGGDKGCECIGSGRGWEGVDGTSSAPLSPKGTAAPLTPTQYEGELSHTSRAARWK